MSGVDDCAVGRGECRVVSAECRVGLWANVVGADEEAGGVFDGLDGGGKADAGGPLFGDVVEAGEAQGEVGLAPEFCLVAQVRGQLILTRRRRRAARMPCAP